MLQIVGREEHREKTAEYYETAEQQERRGRRPRHRVHRRRELIKVDHVLGHLHHLCVRQRLEVR